VQVLSALILSRFVDLNIRGDEGITPLLWFIIQKDANAVELALQLGA
jgi:ankyrin repeat protein